jgi:hypothetical protein
MITFAEYCRQPNFGCDRDTRETYSDWLVTEFDHHRESECRQESNYHVALKKLEDVAIGDEVTELRFGHWAVGWVEHILVRPDTAAHRLAVTLAEKLEDYPLLDEDDHSERQQKAADLTWRDCYSEKERIAYIRRHRSQFDFYDFAHLLGCVRGKYFAGWASELIGR